MKKLFTIMLILASIWANAQTGENPPAGVKLLQTPNNPTFSFYPTDTGIWINMGVYGKAKLQRVNKNYPIWNHTGISNTGWASGKVLKFDVNGNLVPGSSTGGSGIALTDLSATSPVSYNNTTGVFSIASGYTVPTTTEKGHYDSAYGWGNHASSGYVNSILINGGSGEALNGFLDFIPGTNVSITKSGGHVTINSTAGGMIYPGAGIPLSTGSAWGTSITDNSANWNSAYSNMGKTTNSLTFNNSGTGAASGSTFDGSVARTISYNTIGAAALAGSTSQNFDVSSLTVNGVGVYFTGGPYITYSGGLMKFGNTNGTLNMTFNPSTGVLYAPSFSGVTSMTYPGAGIAVSTGSAWTTSITDNSSNWNDAYTYMGKVKLFGTSTYGNLDPFFFSWNTNSISLNTDGSVSQNGLLPINSGAVYTALALKANLSGAAFTGAVSSTSTMTATDFILSSDRRLKENIRPLTNTAWTRWINFVKYNYKNTDRLRYGVIAQDVEIFAPELVTIDEKGQKAVSYIDLLIAKIVDLENRIKKLENEK